MSTQLYDEQTLEIAVDNSMAGDFISAVQDVWAFDCGGVQFSWTGADKTTARVIPQVSIDGVNYCDYISENDSKRIDEAAGCGMYEIQKICFRYLRVRFLAKTNTTGVITVKGYAKRLRYYA